MSFGVGRHNEGNVKGHRLCASCLHSEAGSDGRVCLSKCSVEPTVKEVQTMNVITVLKGAVGINRGCWLHYSEVQVEPYEYTTPKIKMTTGKLHYHLRTA